MRLCFIQCQFFIDFKDIKHLPAFSGFMKVKLDWATGTKGLVLLFVLEVGVLYPNESTIMRKEIAFKK